MLLRSLLTGQRPAPVMVWRRYRAASQASAERWTRRAPGDVTDVVPKDVTPR